MPGKKRIERKMEHTPMCLVKHIVREMKENNFNTRVEAMERIAAELDEMIIKKRMFIRK